jgi:hypothetical protein
MGVGLKEFECSSKIFKAGMFLKSNVGKVIASLVDIVQTARTS